MSTSASLLQRAGKSGELRTGCEMGFVLRSMHRHTVVSDSAMQTCTVQQVTASTGPPTYDTADVPEFVRSFNW